MSVQKKLNQSLLLFCICCFSISTIKAETIQRTYSWNYNGKNFSNTFDFNSSTYNYYKKTKRRFDDFTYYMQENNSYRVITGVSNSLKAIAQKNKFTEWQTVEFIAAFVQSINYKDDGYYEYPRFPVETLIDNAGDCEDTAILLASILRYLGYKTILVSPKGHMGVGIAVKEKLSGNAFPYNGENYYYIETTSAGWGIGDYPDHLSADATIYDPGQNTGAKALSSKSSFDYTATAENTSQEKNNTSEKTSISKTPASSEKNNSKNTNTQTASTNDTYSYEYTPSYTIDEDIMIINGEKETVVTKGKYDGNEFEVVAEEK
ncbi:MAG: transglutaminase family protein [Fimbriimonadaceae bacterium]|nr:transglutaminase family protein [Chitinophagales bacterium]